MTTVEKMGKAQRRYRVVSAKRGELKAAFGRDDCGNISIQYAWGGGGAQKPDARILCNALEENKVFGGQTLAQELEARGYDLTTLRFTIQLAAISHAIQEHEG